MLPIGTQSLAAGSIRGRVVDPGRIELPSQGESTGASTRVVRGLSRPLDAHGRASSGPSGCEPFT